VSLRRILTRKAREFVVREDTERAGSETARAAS
jgi:hypothetical protein